MLPNKDCHELCVRSTNVPGKSLQCIVSQWSDCKADKENPSGCSQSRTNYKETKNSTCGVKYTESRDCYADACPVAENDYLVFLDMKVEIPAILWSYAYTNTFVATLCDMFKVTYIISSVLCELYIPINSVCHCMVSIACCGSMA